MSWSRLRSPAYVSRSRLTTRQSVCVRRWRTKCAPMNPQPPVMRTVLPLFIEMKVIVGLAQRRQRGVLEGENRAADRPVDGDVPIVPDDPAVEALRVFLRELVGHGGVRAQHAEAVREARRDVNYLLVVVGKVDAHP